MGPLFQEEMITIAEHICQRAHAILAFQDEESTIRREANEIEGLALRIIDLTLLAV